MDLTAPNFILFAQHGWADDNKAMLSLSRALTNPQVKIVAPCLNYAQTWLRIAPLIDEVERIAVETLDHWPNQPLRIIGHSMGGLIWLEVLDRHPNWWAQVHSLVLVASPVGGADLGRMLDPLAMGLGIAADLGKSRRAIAEKIAAQIPTLVIAGDIDNGSDGTVPVASTQFAHTQFVRLSDLSHPALRNHPTVAATIAAFWTDTSLGETLIADPVIDRLRAIPGMTDGHPRDFAKAKTFTTLQDGSTIRVGRNPWGIPHVYVASAAGQCLYSGFIGWLHESELWQVLQVIKTETEVAAKLI